MTDRFLTLSEVKKIAISYFVKTICKKVIISTRKLIITLRKLLPNKMETDDLSADSRENRSPILRESEKLLQNHLSIRSAK